MVSISFIVLGFLGLVLMIALIAYAVVRIMQGLTYNGKDRK